MSSKSRIAVLAVVAAALALAGLSLAAAARWSAIHAADAARAEASAAAQRLGTILQTAVSTARLRASAIAGTPSVRAAVETDAATVRDMARAQGFVFSPGAGETIELFQLQRGHRPLSLLRAPEHARPIALTAADEVHVAVDAGALVVTVAAPSTPLYAHGGLKGAVAVATRVDLGPLVSAVAGSGVQAEVTGLEMPLSLSSPPPSEHARAVTAPVPLAAGGAPRLMVRAAVHAVGGTALWAGRALLLLALGTALLLVVEHRRRRDGLVPAAEEAPTTPIAVNAPAASMPPLTTVKEKLRSEGDRHLVLAWSANMPTPITQLKPAQESAPIVVDTRGDQLDGRYRLLQPLGRGSVADVYLAQSFVAGAPGTVALKMLQPGAAPADRQHYLEAARRQSRVTHPNVVQVHDVSTEDFAYVAMEYVEGCTLEQLLREIASTRESLPLPQAVAIVSAICRALDAAQEARDDRGARKPLVHGAVKPSNVLVGRHNVIKLGDFGALPSPSDRHAPEQYAGKRPDRRSDVYAVGLILHELVTGRRWAPPPADTKQWPPLPAPTSLRPELPRALDHVVAKATRFGPRGRHATAGELEADLMRATADAAHVPTPLLLGDWVERARRS